jgi:hypothetical protein
MGFTGGSDRSPVNTIQRLLALRQSMREGEEEDRVEEDISSSRTRPHVLMSAAGRVLSQPVLGALSDGALR